MKLALPQELLTGIQAVDEQHAALVALHNEIVDGFDGDRPPYYTIEALARLYQYSRQHFESEERIMERYGYVGYEEHKEAHAELLEELRKIVLEYRRKPDGVTDSIKRFVHDWVIAHIRERDMCFASPVLEAMAAERRELGVETAELAS